MQTTHPRQSSSAGRAFKTSPRRSGRRRSLPLGLDDTFGGVLMGKANDGAHSGPILNITSSHSRPSSGGEVGKIIQLPTLHNELVRLQLSPPPFSASDSDHRRYSTPDRGDHGKSTLPHLDKRGGIHARSEEDVRKRTSPGSRPVRQAWEMERDSKEGELRVVNLERLMLEAVGAPLPTTPDKEKENAAGSAPRSRKGSAHRRRFSHYPRSNGSTPHQSRPVSARNIPLPPSRPQTPDPDMAVMGVIPPILTGLASQAGLHIPLGMGRLRPVSPLTGEQIGSPLRQVVNQSLEEIRRRDESTASAPRPIASAPDPTPAPTGFFFKADGDMQFDLQEATAFMHVLQKESKVRFVALAEQPPPSPTLDSTSSTDAQTTDTVPRESSMGSGSYPRRSPETPALQVKTPRQMSRRSRRSVDFFTQPFVERKEEPVTSRLFEPLLLLQSLDEPAAGPVALGVVDEVELGDVGVEGGMENVRATAGLSPAGSERGNDGLQNATSGSSHSISSVPEDPQNDSDLGAEITILSGPTSRENEPVIVRFVNSADLEDEGDEDGHLPLQSDEAGGMPAHEEEEGPASESVMEGPPGGAEEPNGLYNEEETSQTGTSQSEAAYPSNGDREVVDPGQSRETVSQIATPEPAQQSFPVSNRNSSAPLPAPITRAIVHPPPQIAAMNEFNDYNSRWNSRERSLLRSQECMALAVLDKYVYTLHLSTLKRQQTLHKDLIHTQTRNDAHLARMAAKERRECISQGRDLHLWTSPGTAGMAKRCEASGCWKSGLYREVGVRKRA
ncbi:uncharacterized protein EV422DRAFT_615160 [Fimicolochytrium jonesii]|uniref:uncharacterized protein n=1 Tax=Fimicolochytrium jonesii TaxID=1396493 RepID=UPI0022FEDE2B|nr:uncharacterized protein EV422DRAFT_615160 [Fimicolochytrium jonesii]KAI8821767.1 hypothetical protein EV422DRAFT_615160 [Fimicolochytrium jonesii]